MTTDSHGYYYKKTLLTLIASVPMSFSHRVRGLWFEVKRTTT